MVWFGLYSLLLTSQRRMLTAVESKPTVYSLHGALLATAELARRGLLLPVKLPLAVEGARRGLAYEELKGSQPLGAGTWICLLFITHNHIVLSFIS